jgi:hypothetical protein
MQHRSSLLQFSGKSGAGNGTALTNPTTITNTITTTPPILQIPLNPAMAHHNRSTCSSDIHGTTDSTLEETLHLHQHEKFNLLYVDGAVLQRS